MSAIVECDADKTSTSSLTVESSSDGSSNAASVPKTPSLPLSRSDERLVRFEDTCVLIPDALPRSRGPIFTTKSYSLSLWKKKSASNLLASPTHVHHGLPDDPEPPTHALAAEHVIVKVPVPSISLGSRSKSPPRHAAECHPLSPCLVHRTFSESSYLMPPIRIARSPSLPIAASRPLDPALETIPLRPCCEECLSRVEVVLPPVKEGEPWGLGWNEGVHYTKGALRRLRSNSVPSAHAPRHYIAKHPVVLSSIKVDEVDKKLDTDAGHQPEESSADRSIDDLPSLDAAVILSDDEDQLFPLPSPTHTEKASPFCGPQPADRGRSSTTMPASINHLRDVASDPGPSALWTARTVPPTIPAPIPVPRRSPTHPVEDDDTYFPQHNSHSTSPELTASPPRAGRRRPFPSPVNIFRAGADVLKNMNFSGSGGLGIAV